MTESPVISEIQSEYHCFIASYKSLPLKTFCIALTSLSFKAWLFLIWCFLLALKEKKDDNAKYLVIFLRSLQKEKERERSEESFQLSQVMLFQFTPRIPWSYFISLAYLVYISGGRESFVILCLLQFLGCLHMI